MKRPGRSRFVALVLTHGPICPGFGVPCRRTPHIYFSLCVLRALSSSYAQPLTGSRNLPVTKFRVKKAHIYSFGEPPGWRKPFPLTSYHLTSERTPFSEGATRPEGSELTFWQMKTLDSGWRMKKRKKQFDFLWTQKEFFPVPSHRIWPVHASQFGSLRTGVMSKIWLKLQVTCLGGGLMQNKIWELEIWLWHVQWKKT